MAVLKFLIIGVCIKLLYGCAEQPKEQPGYTAFQPNACECSHWASESYFYLDSAERAIRYFNMTDKEFYPKKIADLKNGARRFDSLLQICSDFLHERIECRSQVQVKGYFGFTSYFFMDTDTSLFLKYDRQYSGNWTKDSIARAYSVHDKKMILLGPAMMTDSSGVSLADRTYFDSVQDAEKENRMIEFQKMLDYSDSMHPFNRALFRKKG